MAFGRRALGSTLTTTLVVQAASLISGVIVARTLGPEGRGQYAAVLLFPTIIAGLAAWGFVPTFARRAAEETARERFKELAGQVLASALFQTLLAGAALAILFILDYPRGGIARLAFAYGLAWIPVNLCGLFLQALDLGRGDWYRYNLLRIVINPVYVLLLLAHLVFGHLSLTNVLLSLWLASAVTVALRWGLALRDHGLPRIAIEKYPGALSEGAPFAAALYSTNILAQLDAFIAVSLLPAATLGIFVIAQTVAQVFAPLTKAVGVIAFSDSARESRQSGEAEREKPLFSEEFCRRLRLIVAGYSVLSVLLIAVTPWAIPLVYGADFSASIGLAMVMIPGGYIFGISTILDEKLQGLGKPQYGMKSRWLAAILSVSLSLALIGWLGPFALAIGFFSGQAVRGALLTSWMTSELNIRAADLIAIRRADFSELSIPRWFRLSQ